MFDLHITCTKDISFLKIDFVDGTSVIGDNTENKVKNKQKNDKQENFQHRSNNNIDENVIINDNEKVRKNIELPVIEEKHHNKVKVADELQNLEL